MNAVPLDITLDFSPEDRADIEARGLTVPPFGNHPLFSPLVGDMLRFGGKQYIVMARVWEHSAERPTLVLEMSNSATQTYPPTH